MIRVISLFLFLCSCTHVLCVSVRAADWLTLVGTEPPGRDFKWWGIIQPQYVHDYGKSLSGLTGKAARNNGKLVVKNTASPWFDEREAFSLRRLRLGMRGRFTGRLKNSFTSAMSYFCMIEAGQNPMTFRPFGERDRPLSLSELFLTFTHIPHIKIQAGLFKNTGPEEIMQPAGFFGDYIQRPSFIGKDYLEFFAKGALIGYTASGKPRVAGKPGTTGYGFSAARDWGIQAFNTIRAGEKWHISWAVKLGRGESISTASTWNHTPEVYIYTSAEYRLPGGRGPLKNGIKLYSWFQWGRRTFASDPEKRAFDRLRYGVGFKALAGILGIRHRLAMDFMLADGMIFMGPAGQVKGGPMVYAPGTGNRNRGLTVDYGIYVRKWQFNCRWHLHQVLLHTDGDAWNSSDRRNINEYTLGIRYNFTDRIRIICDYMMRDIKASDNNSRNVDITVNSVGNRIALEFTWIF